MNPNQKQATCEALDVRRFLTGVTLITHGFQSDGVMPQWVARMAEGVDRRIEPAAASAWQDVARFRMRITSSDSTTATVESFVKTAGPNPGSSTTGEAVIELDWAAASGLSGPSTAIVAQAVFGAFQNPSSSLGFGNRGILGLPMHFIGHSRGASLVADLARQLGTIGIVVDHLTTLDPFPLGADPGPSRSVSVPDNVLFADNYYENTDFLVYGGPVEGAANTGPLNLPGGASLAHSDVHTYYHGTIDRGDTTDGDITINTGWYGTTENRAKTAFDWTRLSGGARPVSGLGSVGGGTAARVHVDTPGVVWPFAQTLSIAGGVDGLIRTGNQVTIQARYQVHTTSGEIDYYLDTDRNLTNGFSRFFSAAAAIPPTGATPNTAIATATSLFPVTTGPAALAAGLYYINAIITDGSRVRFFSLPNPMLITSAGAKIITRQWSDDVGSHDATDPRNYSPGGTPALDDQLLIGFGTASTNAVLPMKSLALIGAAQYTASFSQVVSNLDLLGSSRLTLEAVGTSSLAIKTLSLSAGARIDLKDNTMVVDYTGASPLAMIGASIRNAFAGGAWTGPGVGSSLASAPGRTVGFAESGRIASSFPATIGGVSVDSTAIVIRYTIHGDANLDRAVDFDDLLIVAQHYESNSATYADGDADFDNDVDFDDLLVAAQQYDTARSHSVPMTTRRRTSRLGGLGAIESGV